MKTIRLSMAKQARQIIFPPNMYSSFLDSVRRKAIGGISLPDQGRFYFSIKHWEITDVIIYDKVVFK
jgi:hypothetical protein